MKFGPELMRQAGVLAGFTEDAPRFTRTYLSPEHKQAGEYLIGLMRDAGMAAGFDVSFTIDLRSGDDATRRFDSSL